MTTTDSTTSPTSPEATPPGTPETTRRFVDAYKRCESEMLAVDPRTFITINLDVPSVVTIALNAVVKIRGLRPQIAEKLSGFDLARFDKLEDYTRALAQAHAMFIGAAAATGTLIELNQEALKVREALVNDAVSLSRHGYIDPTRLDDLSGATGYKNVAFDLLALVGIFHERWSEVASATPVKLDDLHRAEQLAEGMLELLGARESASVKAAQAAEMRQRAFTLFMDAYDDARSAVTFLRWRDGDADEIAPSVYTVRKNGRKREAGAVGSDESGAQTFSPSAPSTDIRPPAPSASSPGATPSSPSGSAPAASPGPSTIHNPDVPGSSPFVS